MIELLILGDGVPMHQSWHTTRRASHAGRMTWFLENMDSAELQRCSSVTTTITDRTLREAQERAGRPSNVYGSTSPSYGNNSAGRT